MYWSHCSPHASEDFEGYPLTSVKFSLSNLLHSQALVGKLTEIFLADCGFGTVKEMSSAEDETVKIWNVIPAHV